MKDLLAEMRREYISSCASNGHPLDNTQLGLLERMITLRISTNNIAFEDLKDFARKKGLPTHCSVRVYRAARSASYDRQPNIPANERIITDEDFLRAWEEIVSKNPDYTRQFGETSKNFLVMYLRSKELIS